MKETINPVGYLDYIPFAKKAREKIENDVACYGMQQAAVEIVKTAGKGKLEVFGKNEEVTRVLRDEGALVVVNHPFYAEIISIVSALEPREDIHLVGISNFLGIGPSFSKHIIPIFATEQMKKQKQKFPIIIGSKLNFGVNISPDLAHEANIQSITNASEKVNEGGVVVMFPEGTKSGAHNDWLDGIGYIVLNVNNYNSRLLFAYIDGVSNWDIARMVPGLRRAFPKISVTFSDPLKFDDFTKSTQDPKEIRSRIESIALLLFMIPFKKTSEINLPNPSS